jgi:hypothetical protein
MADSTRRRDRLALPTDARLTPGTFAQEIALAPGLVPCVERAGMLAQMAALLPYLSYDVQQ